MLALCELGLRDLRIPISDFLDSAVWDRARILRSYGFRFTAFFAGPPDAGILSQLRAHPDELDTLEMIAPIHAIGSALGSIVEAIDITATRLQITPLLPPEHGEEERAGKHKIRCGFDTDEDAIIDALAPFQGRGVALVAGITKPLGTLDAATLKKFTDFSARSGIATSLLASWSETDKDDAPTDTETLARHISRVAPIAKALTDPDTPRIFLDTFMEFDRSYHPRPGLIDRRANLTAAGLALLATFR